MYEQSGSIGAGEDDEDEDDDIGETKGTDEDDDEEDGSTTGTLDEEGVGSMKLDEEDASGTNGEDEERKEEEGNMEGIGSNESDDDDSGVSYSGMKQPPQPQNPSQSLQSLLCCLQTGLKKSKTTSLMAVKSFESKYTPVSSPDPRRDAIDRR